MNIDDVIGLALRMGAYGAREEASAIYEQFQRRWGAAALVKWWYHIRAINRAQRANEWVNRRVGRGRFSHPIGNVGATASGCRGIGQARRKTKAKHTHRA